MINSDGVKVHVEFTVTDRDKFMDWLKTASEGANSQEGSVVIGYRADDQVQRRQALALFVDQMETKLRKNDHKTTWREKPIQALVDLMLLELEEFKVAHTHFMVGESRPELVDVANFAMIVWDRLGMVNQDLPFHVQT